MKDNFSEKSAQYARYRPSYPKRFFEYLDSLVSTKQLAWDCGTGNGQVAIELAKSYDMVYATDISKSQIKNVFTSSNIEYSIQAVEQTNFKDSIFDIIVVSQAIHWFNFTKFYNKVNRTAKYKALLCVVGYGNISVSKKIDSIIEYIYKEKLESYWDPERRYVDEAYQSIPFPYKEVITPSFKIEKKWDFEHLIGYLNTWSATKHYNKKTKHNIVNDYKNKLKKEWGSEKTKKITFPVLLRIGKVN